MNKSELLKALEVKLGSRKAASDALEAVVDTIIREVAKGGSVGITGFGTFEKVARAARTGRNPRTGETVRIRKTSVPKFRPGTQFKEYVAAPSKMPKSGMVGIRASAGTKTTGAGGGGTARTKASVMPENCWFNACAMAGPLKSGVLRWSNGFKQKKTMPAFGATLKPLMLRPGNATASFTPG